MNLNVNEWKPFQVGRLFTMLNGKGITQDEISENDGSLIAVQSGEGNNGVIGKIDLNYCKQMKYTYTEKPCLTVARSGSAGFVSFQIHGCVVGDSAKILLLPDDVASPMIYTFLQTVLTANKFKYTYGRKVTETKYLNDWLDLPILKNDNGKPYIDKNYTYSDDGYVPDWQFMENYMKSLHHKPLTTKNQKGQAPDLNIKSWKSFSVGRLFTMLNGKGITQEEIAENAGDFIAVQSGEDNNGVMGKIDLNYCKKMKYTYSEKPCLTVARSGSAGFVSYQKYGCVVGDSAKILLLPNEVAKTEHYLFLQTILTANRFKYTYGHKVTENKYLDDVIDLPIQHNTDGSILTDSSCKYSDEGYIPDWKFMENYIRSLPYGDRI